MYACLVRSKLQSHPSPTLHSDAQPSGQKLPSSPRTSPRQPGPVPDGATASTIEVWRNCGEVVGQDHVSPPLPRPDYDDDPIPTTDLPRYDAPAYTYQFLVTDLKVLTYGDTTVYKGSLQDPETPEPTPVVIKTDFYAKATRPSDFQREADMYELKLHEVQGVSIPRCFGLFQYTEVNNRISSFLVLEYSGEPILSSRGLSTAFKGAALAKLHKIHHAGYEHGDLHYANITNLNGVPFFIDLEFAEPHKCNLREKIFPGQERKLVPCAEMSQCATMLDAWAPDVQFLANCFFPRHKINETQSTISWRTLTALATLLKNCGPK